MKERHIAAIQRHKRPIYAINKETGIQGYQSRWAFSSKTSGENSFSQTKKTNPLHKQVNYMNQNQEIDKKKKIHFEKTKIKVINTQKTKGEGERCYLSLARFW